MLCAKNYIKNLSLIRRSLRNTEKFGASYSQRCDVDDCNCLIEQPKCKKRPNLVQEVNCEKCIFECWEYKPRPRFEAKKTEDELKEIPRVCTPTMTKPKWKTTHQNKEEAEICQQMNTVGLPVGVCPKTDEGVLSTKCKENPYQFENDKIPLPDWDHNKKPDDPLM